MNTKFPEFEQEREQILRRIFNAASHDLKTPLACIIGSLEILEKMKESLSSEQRDSLIQSAILEAHKLDGLITDMLEKVKPETGE